MILSLFIREFSNIRIFEYIREYCFEIWKKVYKIKAGSL